MQIVGYYKQRWWIEQLFRTLKKQGLKLEDTQLEDGEAIEKLSVYALVTALKIMQLVKARNDNGVKITAVFDHSKQQCLKDILPKLNGKTLKQQNPYQSSQLAWATWIVARLGRWDGFAPQRPPGVIIIIHIGLEKFATSLKLGINASKMWVHSSHCWGEGDLEGDVNLCQILFC